MPKDFRLFLSVKAQFYASNFNHTYPFPESWLLFDLFQCDYRQPTAESATIGGGKLLTTMGGSSSWARGSYQCLCRRGFYSLRHPDGFNGTIMEIAWQEQQDNISNYYTDVFKCLSCAPGCDTCTGPEPCLANFNWPFRWDKLFI